MSQPDPRRRLKLRHAINWMLGPDSEPLLQAQLLFALTASLFLLASAVFNLMSNIADPRLSWFYLMLTPASVWLWYLGRWRGQVVVTTNIILFMLSFVILPLNWIYNGGADGPTILVAMIALAYGLGIHQKGNNVQRAALLMFLFLPALLYSVEFRYPDLIHRYADQTDRISDLVVSYVLCSISIGVIILGHTRRFRQELERADELAAQLAILAERDGLTGLYNHRRIHQQLQYELESGRAISICVLDIDHFKQINDRYGHQAGDKVLVEMARLIGDVAERYQGVAGRLGGEEFLVIIPGSPESARHFDAELRESLRAAFPASRAVTFSSGISRSQPGKSLDDLVGEADSTMYRAKVGGRNQTLVTDA